MWKWIANLLKLNQKHDIFISYAKENTDIVEENGVKSLHAV
jgi:hypothetical protein